MAPSGKKAEGAFLTIGELSDSLGVAQHILRYWETRFPALKPLQRAGRRRYYRPADVALARRIYHLLHVDGMSIADARLALGKERRTTMTGGTNKRTAGEKPARAPATVNTPEVAAAAPGQLPFDAPSAPEPEPVPASQSQAEMPGLTPHQIATLRIARERLSALVGE